MASGSLSWPVGSHDPAGNSIYSSTKIGFDPNAPGNGLKIWISSRDPAYLRQNSGGTGAVVSDGDPVGYILDKGATGQTFVQTTSGRRPTYKVAVKNGYPVIRFSGRDDPRNLIGVGTPLDTGQSCTILATLANREPGPPVDSYVATIFLIGSIS